MEKRKESYEAEIARILKRTMEVSYLRKKNRQTVLALLQSTPGAPGPAFSEEDLEDGSLDSLLKSYTLLKDKVINNLK